MWNGATDHNHNEYCKPVSEIISSQPPVTSNLSTISTISGQTSLDTVSEQINGNGNEIYERRVSNN